LLQPCFAEVEFPESNFADQIELLLKDPEEKEKFFQVWIYVVFNFLLIGWIPVFTEAIWNSTEYVIEVEGSLNCDYFFQDVFPTDFGPDYDSALQVLMLDFLSRLEKLLPVPDIQQVTKHKSA